MSARMREQDELAAFDKAFELATQLAEAMGNALAEHGLTTARAEVLYVLHNQGPLVQRQLAHALKCTPRHVTTLIDTLQTAGLVHRTPHPTDRRATLVTLTDHGQDLADELDQARRHAAHAILADATATQLRGFTAIADRIIDHIGQAATVNNAERESASHSG
jgi:DNA-binding MarR family transcriptional regulator